MTDTALAPIEGHTANPSVRTEPRDINPRIILAVAVGLAIGVVLVSFVSLWVFDGFVAYERKIKRSRFPLSADLRGRLPPEPRLEQIHRLEAGEAVEAPTPLYTDEQRRLDSYGWVDKKAGVVHIPIERAMKMVVEENRGKP